MAYFFHMLREYSWQCQGRIAKTMRLVLFTMFGRLFFDAETTSIL